MKFQTTADSPNRIRDKQWVEETYNLDEFGCSAYEIYTLKRTLIAIGYIRIVYGDHGPYIELDEKNLIEDNWKPIIRKSKYAYYDERYPIDGSECMLYIQKRRVTDLANPPKGKRSVRNDRIGGYADYRVGKLYISPEFILPQKAVDLSEL